LRGARYTSGKHAPRSLAVRRRGGGFHSLEERGWIKGAWVEKPDERRRRFYKLTADGKRVLAQQKKTWAAFVEAVRRVTGGEHA
jgi:DNA-binding PadR family transcriptional regulator